MSVKNQNHFIKAIRYIHANIDQPITLEEIAKASDLSKSSLKRLFLETTNQSAGAFVRRMRMELAFRSLQNREDSVLEIALQAGFLDHAAFSRSFKETFGYSPSFARTKHNLISELESVSLEEPEIVDVAEFTIQSVTHQGLYFEAAPQAWQSLKEHLSQTELDDDFAGSFIGIGHDNPHEGHVAENKVRFTAGVSFLKQDLALERTQIAKGHYAKFHYQGKLHNLGLAYHYIYGAWLETSGFKISFEKPAFLVFDQFPDGFKEQTLAIYVPL